MSSSFDPSKHLQKSLMIGCCGICWLGAYCVKELGLGAELCDLKPAGSGVPGFLQPVSTPAPQQVSLPGGELFGLIHSIPFTQPALTPSLCSTVFAKNFRVAAAMKTSVLLSWEVPDSYKSAVPFKVGEGCDQPSPHLGRLWAVFSALVGICVHS